jgi:hypothetical protein
MSKKKLYIIPINKSISINEVSFKHLPLKGVAVKKEGGGVYAARRHYQPNKKEGVDQPLATKDNLKQTEVMMHDANGNHSKVDLIDIVKMDDAQLSIKLKDHLEHIYGKDKVEHDPDLFTYAKGENPIALLAHIDTIPRKSTDAIKYTEKDGKMVNDLKFKDDYGNREGDILGADDRAGIFGILKTVSHCVENNIPKPSVVFTDGEEAMGRGMIAFCHMNKFDPKGVNLLVALDRHGGNEYVYYSHNINKNIKKYVESYGFENKRGIFSDCLILSSATQIPHVNLSIGYHDEHRPQEMLNIKEMNNVVDKVTEMVKNPIKKLYKLTLGKDIREFPSVPEGDKNKEIEQIRKDVRSRRDYIKKRQLEHTETQALIEAAAALPKKPNKDR